MPPHEKRHVFAVLAPSMGWVVSTINNHGCAHLVLQIVPHATMPGQYWMICQADSWLRQRFDGMAAAGGLLE